MLYLIAFGLGIAATLLVELLLAMASHDNHPYELPPAPLDWE